MPMLARLTALFLLALALAAPAAAQEFLDPQVAFQPSASKVDAASVEVRFTIAKGYYLYRDKFRFAAPGATFGTPAFPKGQMKKDDLFGDVEVFHDQVTIRLPVQGTLPATITVTSQGCAEGGICYPPQEMDVAVAQAGGPGLAAFTKGAGANAAPGAASGISTPESGANAGPSADTPAAPEKNTAAADAADGDESGAIARMLRHAGFWANLAAFFVAGLGLSLTPCMLPMVPILSGIIVGSGKVKPARGRATVLAVAYVLGMAVTYALAGVAAGLTGTLLSALMQNPWVLGFFALVFIALSLAMFGFYELQMPAFLQSKVSEEASHLKGGSLPGVAAMGALSALIVGPCVAAPLAGALLYIGQTRDALLGGAALFTLALGMGAPLIALGASAGTLLVKAGPWMARVNQTFGVLLLATALWLVGPVLPEALVMIGWGLLALVPAIYLHALDPLPAGTRPWQRFWKGLGVVLLVYGAAVLVGALAGGRDPLQPLKPFAAPAGALGTVQAAASEGPRFERVANLAELDARLRTTDRPVMLDFYADWCVSCKEMERFTFTDPKVRARLDQFLLLQADVTANSAADKALLARFNLFGPPGILFFDAAGEEVRGHKVVGFQNAEKFAASLDRVLAK